MAGGRRPTRKGEAMAAPTGLPLVGKVLLASALGCGATGVLFLQDYTLLGLVLCAVALADLGLVWLLWWWSLACRADPRPSSR
jgi:hypothetical protein